MKKLFFALIGLAIMFVSCNQAPEVQGEEKIHDEVNNFFAKVINSEPLQVEVATTDPSVKMVVTIHGVEVKKYHPQKGDVVLVEKQVSGGGYEGFDYYVITEKVVKSPNMKMMYRNSLRYFMDRDEALKNLHNEEIPSGHTNN